MKSVSMQRTLGMLGTGLVTFMQNQLWRGALAAAREHDARLIYFPTISLSAWPPFPPQPKALFDLVSDDSLDGLLVWYAGIAEGLGIQEGRHFLRRYGSLPIVTMGGMLPDLVDLSVDNYRGARASVKHLIEEHRRRHIAVIRGPVGHPDADERYRAYVDEMREHGLPIDPRRVAEVLFELKTVAQNVEDIVRKWLMDPDNGIDAIVTASDYMALSAIKAIESCGKLVPEDIAVIGFDDIDDSQASVPSLTTVRQPFFEMGHRSVEILLGMLDGERPPERSLMPAPLIRRESCGCLGAQAMPIFNSLGSGAAIPSDDPLAELKNMAKELTLPLSDLGGLLKALEDSLESDDPFSEKSDRFFNLLRHYLALAIQSYFNATVWQNAVNAAQRYIMAKSGGDISLAGESVLSRTRVLIAEITQRAHIKRRITMELQSENLRQISESLITSFGKPLLAETLHEQLPKLGFPSFYLSLYENPEDPSHQVRLIISYEDGLRVDLPPDGLIYPTGLIVPGLSARRPKSLVVEPLYFRDEQIGILLLEPGPTEGPIYENLRAEISSALQGSKLLQQVEQHATQLERSVAERTTELTETVSRMQVEIAERMKAEKALRLASFAIGHILDAIFWISSDGKISDVNDAACGMLGYARGEILGRPLSSIDPAFRPEAWKDFWERVKSGAYLLHESTLAAKDGRSIPVEIMDNFIAFEDKELICAIVRDISRRKENELAIRRMNEDLERRVAERTKQLEYANGELEAFAYSVSHDLRAPLRAISGFSAILTESYAQNLPREAGDYLERIRGNTQRMGELISDLLSFSRAGRDQMRLEPVDSLKLIRKIIAELKSNGELGKVEFLVDESMPPCKADRSMLRQVWINLISNAVKYSGKRESPRIEIGHRFEDGKEVFFIKDNGVGFDMRWADKLFGVFQRLHSVDEFEGTGIGLAMARRIIRRHDGDIWAQAKVDSGATFSFYLGTG
jgi:PAS domain S-box-containing protein